MVITIIAECMSHGWIWLSSRFTVLTFIAFRIINALKLKWIRLDTFFPLFTHVALNVHVINYSVLKMIAGKCEGKGRWKRWMEWGKESFKQQITLIAQCVNIEIQYVPELGVGEEGKWTLINDVWCGFTNYIFQAFKSETRLIAGKSFSNVENCWFFLSNYDRSTHKLRVLNESFSAVHRECLLKISLKVKERYFFVCLCFFPSNLPPSKQSPTSSVHLTLQLKNSREQIRWNIFRKWMWCEKKFLNLLFKWVEICLKFTVDICQIRQQEEKKLSFDSLSHAFVVVVLE